MPSHHRGAGNTFCRGRRGRHARCWAERRLGHRCGRGGGLRIASTADIPNLDPKRWIHRRFHRASAYTCRNARLVDITPSTFPTTYDGLGPLTPSTLAAGTPVDSYFMVAPVGLYPYVGTVTFSTPILGVIIETSTLRATNSIVGAPGTTYEDFPSQGLKGDDYVELVGPSTLHLDLRSSEFVDEVRWITAVSPGTSPGGYGQGGSTGYTEVASDGGIFNFETQFYGSMVVGRSINQWSAGPRSPDNQAIGPCQGRRDLLFRQRRVLRIDGRTDARISDSGHGFDARWTRLLAGGF